ncbi:hypothetical protein M422DRAFT_248595 [Sphaerobolus stellatus SS14]|nr:hypothetical protein M422DRAFT_248595 [Sphaerobolus stellatus SS14]
MTSYPQTVKDITLTTDQISWLNTLVEPFHHILSNPGSQKEDGLGYVQKRLIEFEQQWKISTPEGCADSVSLAIRKVWEDKIYQYLKNRHNKCDPNGVKGRRHTAIPLKSPRAEPGCELYIQSLGRAFHTQFEDAMQGLESTQSGAVRQSLRKKLWDALTQDEQCKWTDQAQEAKASLMAMVDAGDARDLDIALSATLRDLGLRTGYVFHLLAAGPVGEDGKMSTFNITHAPDGSEYQNTHVDYQTHVYEPWKRYAAEAHATYVQKERTKQLLGTNAEGRPMLPQGDPSWSQGHRATLLKAYFDQMWYIHSGRKAQHILAPWAKIATNNTKFIGLDAFPSGFHLRDPCEMTLLEIATLYQHVLSHQSDAGSITIS